MATSIVIPNNQIIGGNPQAICDALNATATSAAADINALGRACRLATAAALPAYTNVAGVLTASAVGALATIDGVAPAVGNRVLLVAGAAGADNGIYTVTALGGAGAKFVLTRAADFAQGYVLPGQICEVTEGALYALSTWKLVTLGPIVVGTTALSFYPRSVTQLVTLIAGAATVANVPILSATNSQFVFARITPNTTASTVNYGLAAAPTPGLVGTATLALNAQLAAGTLNNADISAGNFTVQNWLANAYPSHNARCQHRHWAGHQ